MKLGQMINGEVFEGNKDMDIPLMSIGAEELAKAFARNRYLTLNIDDTNKYLGVPVNEQMVLVQLYPKYMNAMLVLAVNKYLSENGFTVDRETNYYYNEKEIPVEYVDLIISRGVTKNLLNKGYLFCSSSDRKVVFSINFSESVGFIEVTYNKKDKDFFAGCLNIIAKYIDEFDYMRGEKISADGRLLNINKYDWDDIVLEDGIKEEIENNILNFFEKKELYFKNGIPFKKGIMLEGPPGTGKTLISKIVANKVKGCTFILATAKDMEGSEDVANLFNLARRLAPSIIFMEDIDFFGPSRNSAGRVMRMTGELLNQMDGIEDNNGILIIASTNHKELIDDALLKRPGRFDIILHIGELSLKNREILLSRFLENKQITQDVNLYEIAEMCEGFSGSYIRDLANDVCIQAINFGLLDDDGYIILVKEFFVKAIERIKKQMGIFPSNECTQAICDEPEEICKASDAVGYVKGFDGFLFMKKNDKRG